MATIKSIEEKAKAYDEAIKKAKNTIEVNRNIPDIVECIESLFPALKESEDERIRKWIRKELESKYVVDNIVNNEMADKALAWLEKQGEQKSIDEIAKEVSKDKTSAIAFLKASGIMNENGELAEQYRQSEQNPADKIEPKFKVKYAGSEYNVLVVKDIAGVTFYGIEDEPNHIDYVLPNNCEIVSEQKLADKVEPKFKVGQTIIYKGTENIAPTKMTISDIANGQYWDDNCCIVPISDQDNWELVEQKPAFEMKTPEESLDIDSDTYSKIVDECVYGEQKPVWSKHDETLLNCCLGAINTTDYFDNDNKDEMEKWLKSLRPQSQWKPNDMELEVLRLAAEKDGTCLMGLYEQLKKLREE